MSTKILSIIADSMTVFFIVGGIILFAISRKVKGEVMAALNKKSGNH